MRGWPMPDRPEYVAVFRSTRPWPNDERAIRQLRATLKDLLRRHGWQCRLIAPSGTTLADQLTANSSMEVAADV